MLASGTRPKSSCTQSMSGYPQTRTLKFASSSYAQLSRPQLFRHIARADILDQPQQHARAGVGVGELDMLIGMVADAAAAAHEDHADIGDVDHRHAVMPRPARQLEH